MVYSIRSNSDTGYSTPAKGHSPAGHQKAKAAFRSTTAPKGWLLLCVAILLFAAGTLCCTAAAEEAVGAAVAAYSPEWKAFEGEGTAEDPFLISTYEDLARMRDFVDAGVTYKGCHFAQTSDITFPEGVNWDPIGSHSESKAFSGTYDGQGHVISNIVCSSWRPSLFLELDGEVRNLGIESGSFSGNLVGCIASYGTKNAVLFNCYNKASAHGTERAGGIADNLTSGKIISCWNLGEITCEAGVSGELACYNAGQITGCISVKPYTPAKTNKAVIEDCYAFKTDDPEKSVDAFNRMLYHASVERGQKVYYVKLGENGLCFGGADYKPMGVIKQELKALLITYGPLLFLAGLTALFAVWMIVRICKNKISLRAAKAATAEEAQATKEPEGEKKQRTSLTCELALFAVMLLTGLYIANATLVLKKSEGILPMQNFYAQPEDTVDVLIIGSSRVGVNLDVEVLWTNYGISAYALWGESQPFWNSYYYLKEALSYQKPKVVILDAYAATRRIEYGGVSTQYSNIHGMKLSRNKIEAIKVSADQSKWFELLLGAPIYHSRYAELAPKDYQRYSWNASAFADSKGTASRYTPTNLKTLDSVTDTTTVKAIDSKAEDYLRKTIELCRSNNLPLMLVATQGVKIRTTYQPYFNRVQQIADEYGVPFINLNLLDEELDFNLNDIASDDVHLNTNGGRKDSDYLGNYLMENYPLEDHRGDPKYQSWENFAHNTVNHYFTLIKKSDDYLKELARNDRSVIFVKHKAAADEKLTDFLARMQEAGLYSDFLNTPGDGCWVMESTRDSTQIQPCDAAQAGTLLLDGKEFTVSLKERKITCGEEETLAFESGIYCVVYDPYTHDTVDTFKLY